MNTNKPFIQAHNCETSEKLRESSEHAKILFVITTPLSKKKTKNKQTKKTDVEIKTFPDI